MTTMTRATLAALLLPVALGVAPASAATEDPQPVQPFVPGTNEESTLSKAWQRWQATGIDDYVISVRLSCFCVPTDPVRTVIRNDTTRRVTQGERRLAPRRGWSMDELFSLVRSAGVEADRVEVEWTRRGVPASITIDPDLDAADEETYYAVSVVRIG